MPTVTIILVLGLAVGLIGLISMPVALLLSGTVYFILRFYESTAIFISSLPLAMVRTGGGSVLVSALGVLVLCMFAYTFHDFDENMRRRNIFVASIVALVIAVFIQSNPPTLQKTELLARDFAAESETGLRTYHVRYTILRRAADTLIIGAPHGGEEALLRYLDKRGVNRAALMLTHPPLPADTARLARILPRIHTIYLPAHAEGVTEALMNATLAELSLPEAVFLQDGEKRVSHGITVQVRALPMGQFEVSVN
jgi:hypothetical protein